MGEVRNISFRQENDKLVIEIDTSSSMRDIAPRTRTGKKLVASTDGWCTQGDLGVTLAVTAK
jgi:hypothetical protein